MTFRIENGFYFVNDLIIIKGRYNDLCIFVSRVALNLLLITSELSSGSMNKMRDVGVICKLGSYTKEVGGRFYLGPDLLESEEKKARPCFSIWAALTPVTIPNDEICIPEILVAHETNAESTDLHLRARWRGRAARPKPRRRGRAADGIYGV